MLDSAWCDWTTAGKAKNVAPNVAPMRASVRLSTVLLGAVGLVVASTMMMDGGTVLFSM